MIAAAQAGQVAYTTAYAGAPLAYTGYAGYTGYPGYVAGYAAQPVVYNTAPIAAVNPYDYAGQVYPLAEPYIHQEVPAEEYQHVEIAAEPYVHQEPAPVPYVHQEPAPVAAIAPVAVAAPQQVISHAAAPAVATTAYATAPVYANYGYNNLAYATAAPYYAGYAGLPALAVAKKA